jgi:hypothetical protein
MNKRTKRLLGGLAIAAGAIGATGTFLKKKNSGTNTRRTKGQGGNLWARSGMTVTFRAELMPGKNREERTVKVKQLLPSGRVTLHEIEGEHGQGEFDPLN